MSSVAISASSAVSASPNAGDTTTTTDGVPPGSAYSPRYIDIGINLADPVFRGLYYGHRRHPDDLTGVVRRARDVGCTKLIVTGSNFKTSYGALRLAQDFPNTIYTTAGIHPCSSAIFEKPPREDTGVEDSDDGEEHVAVCGPDPTKAQADDGEVNLAKSAQIIAELRTLFETATPENALVAFGEIGLDYDRLHYCSASTQRHAFTAQLALVADLAKAGKPMPLFLHSRACHTDFVRLLKEQFGPKLEHLPRGAVVHSFTGTIAEAEELMDLGLYLGVNGCSLKTVENCDVVRSIRLDRLMIETDGPWCEVRPAHEGWKYLVKVAEEARAKAQAVEEERKAAEEAEKAAERAAQAAAWAAAQLETGAAANERPPRPPRRKKQNKNGNNKKEPTVLDRFKAVKKDDWKRGAMVKGRNEPCTIERIAMIIAGIKGLTVEEVCEAAWANTERVFGTL